MKKLLSIFMICIMITFSFSACGNKSNENASKNQGQKVESKSEKNNEKNEGVKENKKDIKEEGFKTPEFILDETDNGVKYKDPLGNEVEIAKKPQRVIVLQNSILDLWYLAGGQAIGRVDGTTNVPEEAKDIEIVGKGFTPNTEKLLELKPDLVIMSATSKSHKEFKNILDENNIQSLYVDTNYEPYKQFKNVLYLFSAINDTKGMFNEKISDVENKINEIVNKIENEKKPKVVILFSTTKSISTELLTSLTGEMVDILKAENIVKDTKVEGAVKVDFSIERIIEQDPDIVLITTMGDMTKVEQRIKDDLEKNEAWASLRAVKEGHVYQLPKDMFTYKPNARYAEAFQYLAKILYPEVFK